MRHWFTAILFAALACGVSRAGETADTRKAALIEITGPIGPATNLYFEHGMEAAAHMQATLIIVRLDTPGGLDGAMRDIIKQILASEIPVVGYVAPSGARAASAGTYILYSCHIAAMAPATNLGAATPIAVFAPSAPGASPASKDGTPPPKPVPSDAGERKAVNDAVAYIRSLAERRNRNADWAEQAVREGVSLSAEQALHKGVIEMISSDTADLLKDLEGHKIDMAKGTVVLHTQGLVVEKIEPDWRMKILAVITNPAAAYILMLIGIYGLLLEGYHPGAILPGVVGGICLLLALYAFQILPINYAGLGLIALGIIMIIAETLVPSGALGIGGVISFVVGSVMLFDTRVPGFQVPIAIIATLAASASAAILVVLLMVVRSRNRAVTTGRDAMLNQPAEALENFEGEEGWVRVLGETWRASCTVPVKRGQRLRVVRMDGLVLTVEPADQR